MENLLVTEIEVVSILLIVSIVAILARYSRLPYTVALVLMGIVLTVQPYITGIQLTEDLVLALFLPPLVFEAAFHLQFRELRSDLWPILTLAVPGVILNTAIVGGILYALNILPLTLALLFGALIAATDPVSVIATFKSVGAPRRLSVLMEGESLFNDGTAIVLFHIAVGIALTGHFSLAESVADFLREAVGGLAVGAIIGYLVAQVIERIDDYLVEITVTTVAAYGSYLIGQEFLHVSGVLAVVMAGLINGNIGIRGMSPTTRIVLNNFWEYIAFLANSFIFLLIGMALELDDLFPYLPAIGAAILAVLAARVVAVYGLGGFVRLFKPDLPKNYLHVMVWGGLRGAVSLALVLGVSSQIGFAAKQQLLAMTFGVVIFSLLVQSITIPRLLRRLGLGGGEPFSLRYEQLQAELLALRAAAHRIDEMHDEGALAHTAWESVKAELVERGRDVSAEIQSLMVAHPELHEGLLHVARREALRAQRAELSKLSAEGLLSDEVIAKLLRDVDAELQHLNSAVPRYDDALHIAESEA
ncbi:MAG: Na+/H+ antiporter [Anaerolineales bacterium]|nr:Na+/H+ antiporter [Anaerolineales bacterium]